MIIGQIKDLTKNKIRELGYRVYKYGFITHMGIIVKTYEITSSDAVFVSIVDYGKNIVWGVEVSRMVAWHYIGPIDGNDVIHIDGNVNNCAADNLMIRADNEDYTILYRLDQIQTPQDFDSYIQDEDLAKTIARYKEGLASRDEWHWWP